MASAVLVFKEHMTRAASIAAGREQEREQAEAAKHAALLAMAETIETRGEAGTGGGRPPHRCDDRSSQRHERIGCPHRRVRQKARRPLRRRRWPMPRQWPARPNSSAASIREIGGQVSQSAAVVGRAVEVGRVHPRDHRRAEPAGGAYRHGRRHDRRDRRSHQSAGAERHHRGRACRRCGQGIRRCRQRGEAARHPDGEVDRGDQPSYRRGSRRPPARRSLRSDTSRRPSARSTPLPARSPRRSSSKVRPPQRSPAASARPPPRRTK